MSYSRNTKVLMVFKYHMIIENIKKKTIIIDTLINKSEIHTIPSDPAYQ